MINNYIVKRIFIQKQLFTNPSHVIIIDVLPTTQLKFPSQLHSARGNGTFCAVSTPSGCTRDMLVHQLQNVGQSTKVANYCIMFLTN